MGPLEIDGQSPVWLARLAPGAFEPDSPALVNGRCPVAHGWHFSLAMDIPDDNLWREPGKHRRPAVNGCRIRCDQFATIALTGRGIRLESTVRNLI
jgi:hypothetical protein